MRKKILLIDHYDSFTYTIRAYFETLKVPTVIVQHDDARLQSLEDFSPSHIVLSPGPGHPDETEHTTLQLIQKYYKTYPFLGICLGHQCLLQAFGAVIVSDNEIMHGKVSTIAHTGRGLFEGIVEPFQATRYHSLVADLITIPATCEVTAWTYNTLHKKVVMAFQHKKYPLFGVQYHPEAILTEHGYQVFQNFLG